MIDKGSHLIDLAQWFLGEFTDVQAVLRIFLEAEVEDNVFLTRRRLKGRPYGCTRLGRNERTCSQRDLWSGGQAGDHWTGLLYGVESLTFYRMLPGMRPPYCGKPKRLDSFQRSTKVRRPIGDAVEAVRSMSVIERMYQGASR